MMTQRNEKISIDPGVLERMEEESGRENRSRSNYIETILMRRLETVASPRRYTVDEKTPGGRGRDT
jgi:hypothetical protein